MAPVSIGNQLLDLEHLVPNSSVTSFQSVNNDHITFNPFENELTVTRSFNNRKYSTMSFKQSRENTVDIVIKKGEYTAGLDALPIHQFTSQDIRQKYSVKARFAVALIALLMFVMLVVLIVTLTQSVKHSGSGSGDVAIATSGLYNTSGQDDQHFKVYELSSNATSGAI